MEKLLTIEEIAQQYRRNQISGEEFATLFKEITDERAAFLAGLAPTKLQQQSQELR